MMDRKYVPTTGELIDSGVITLLKAIHIDHGEYMKRLELIEHDVNMELNRYHGSGKGFSAYEVRMIIVLTLANYFIWMNESKVRNGEGGGDLRATHSINGIRNRAKNNLSAVFDQRLDLKLDCLAADLLPELGKWDVFS